MPVPLDTVTPDCKTPKYNIDAALGNVPVLKSVTNLRPTYGFAASCPVTVKSPVTDAPPLRFATPVEVNTPSHCSVPVVETGLVKMVPLESG